MTLRAPRLGEVIAGLASVALLISLWLPWYGGPGGPNAWQALAVLDYVLLVTAAIGLFVLFAQMTQRSPALAVAFSACGLSVSFVATIWTLIHVLFPPDEAEVAFAWLGLAGVAGVLGGLALGLRDEGSDFWPGPEEAEPASRA
jgi:hypothetical protein